MMMFCRARKLGNNRVVSIQEHDDDNRRESQDTDDEEGEAEAEEAEADAEEGDGSFDPADLRLDLYLLRYITFALMFLYCRDIFAIYKGTHASASRVRYRRYMVAELRMNHDRWDIWQHRWSIIYWFLYLYHTVRILAICLIQITLYRAATNTNQVSGELPSYNEELASIKFLRDYNLMDIFPNALYEYPGISLLLNGSVYVSASYSMYYMPYRYYKKPFNSPLLRFTLDPDREIRRIDLMIKWKIDEMVMLIRNSRGYLSPAQPATFGVGGGMMDLTQATAGTYLARKIEQNSQRKQGAKIERIDRNLRPIRYSHEYYREIWLSTRNITYVIVVLALSFVDIILYEVTNSVWDIRCRAKYSRPDCSLSEALSWPDLRSLVETTIIMIGLGAFVTMQIIETVLHVRSQLTLIGEIKSYLEDLLAALRIINDNLSSRAGNDSNRIPTRILRSNFSVRTSRINGGKSEHLNDALLKTLIKMKIALEDLSQFSQYMSEMVSSILVLFGSILLLTLTAGRIGGQDIETLRASIITTIWVGSNILLIMCAYIFTKMSRIEQIVCSIIAQLERLKAQKLFIFGYELECLIENWENMALRQSASDARYSVRPFGVSLTYRMVLRMNFSVMTLAALLRK